MRVCLICRSRLGGGAAQADYLLRSLPRRGHSVAVVSQIEASRGFGSGTVYRIPVPSTAGGFRPLSWVASGAVLGAASATVAYRQRATVLHAMEVAASGFAGLLAGRVAPAARLLRFGGSLPSEVASHLRPPGWSPRIPPEQAPAHPHPSIRLAALLEKVYLKTYDFVLPTTEYGAGLLQKLGVETRRIRVVPNGIDTEKFAPRTVDRLFDGPTLLAGGRFEPWKGHDTLIEAVARIRPEFPDVRLLMIGEGPEEARLRALARDLGLDERVVFRPPVSHDEFSRLLAAADGVIVPSAFGNIGVSNILHEAMACGRAVVSSAVPEVKEFLEPGRHGLLFPPGDAEGLAESLRTLLGDPELRKRIGEEARRLIAGRFSMEAMVERALGVYEEAEALFQERWARH